MLILICAAFFVLFSPLLFCAFSFGESGSAAPEQLPDCLIDLHLHLDGSLSPAAARALAALQNIEIPESEKELYDLLSVSENCRSLNEYLEKFAFPCSLLQTKQGISEAVRMLCEELKEQGFIYAEIRFAPQKSCDGDLTQEEAVCAALEGMSRGSLKAGLILCCMRGDDNGAENMETVELAAKYRKSGVCAVDLAGAEALFKTENFADLFARARELGLNITIHAGEADGPESIKTALSFGAKRIGHGVRSVEDEELVKKLARSQIPLELCPTSNLNTALFGSYDEYPLKKLMDAGVKATLNTDNLSVSNTCIRKEFACMEKALGLTRGEMRQLLINSAEAAFCDEETRSELVEKINKAFG